MRYRMKFTIITCSYNSLDGLRAACAQLREQVGEGVEIEHIVIDGGSADGTVEALRDEDRSSKLEVRKSEMGDAEIGGDSAVGDGNGQTPISQLQTSNYSMEWISEPDRGLYDALNKGLRMATGEVIGILHTDDVWEEGVLKRVRDAFVVGDCRSEMEDREENSKVEPFDSAQGRHRTSNPQSPTPISNLPTPISHAEGVYGDLLYVDAADVTRVRRVWRSGTYDAKKFDQGWMPPHPALFVTRELAERVGEYRLDLGSAADYEWMLRACRVHNARLAHLPEVLVRMRVGGQSNASVKARLKANGNDRRAWELNGLKPRPWTLILKPVRKLPQWIAAKRGRGH